MVIRASDSSAWGCSRPPSAATLEATETREARWSQLQCGLDGLQADLGAIDSMYQRMAAQLEVASKAADQVGAPSSIASEVAACVVFDDMSLEIGAASRATQLVLHDPVTMRAISHEPFDVFMFPMTSMVAAWEVFDELPPPDVVWDEDEATSQPEQVAFRELQDGCDSHDLLQQLAQGMEVQMRCKQVEFKALLLSEGDANEVFNGTSHRISKLVDPEGCQDEVVSKVIWDEEFGQGLDSYGLLQHIAQHGDCLVSEEWKPMVKVGTDSARAVELEMNFVDEGFMEMHCTAVLSDDMSTDLAVPEGLLGQLALGEEYMNVPQVSDDMPTHVGSLPLSLKVATDTRDGLFGEMSSEIVGAEHIPSVFEMHDNLLQQQAMSAEHLNDMKAKLMAELIQDKMLSIVGSFLLPQEHGMDVRDQMLKKMHNMLMRKMLSTVAQSCRNPCKCLVKFLPPKGCGIHDILLCLFDIYFSAQFFSSPGQFEEHLELYRMTNGQWPTTESFTNGMPTHVVYGVSEGMPCRVVVWDEMPVDLVVHDGLLKQQLASGVEDYLNDEITQPSIELINVQVFTPVAGSPVILEHGKDVTDYIQDNMHSSDMLKDMLGVLVPHCPNSSVDLVELLPVMGREMHNIRSCFTNIDINSQGTDNHHDISSLVCREHFTPEKPSTRRVCYLLKEWPPWRVITCDLERYELDVACLVLDKMAPWGCNAFSSGTLQMQCDRYVVDIVLSLRRKGFGPGNFELTRRMVSLLWFKTSPGQAEPAHHDVVYFSTRIWDPGIWNSRLNGTEIETQTSSSSSGRCGEGELLDLLTPRSSPPVATGRDTASQESWPDEAE